jgi:hypothetical protein
MAMSGASAQDSIVSADGNAASEDSSYHVCGQIGCGKEGSKRCGACKQVRVPSNHNYFTLQCLPLSGRIPAGRSTACIERTHSCILVTCVSCHVLWCSWPSHQLFLVQLTELTRGPLSPSFPCTSCAMQVWCCSAECQRTHWADGGHKGECKAVPAAASQAGWHVAVTPNGDAVSSDGTGKRVGHDLTDARRAIERSMQGERLTSAVCARV